MADNVCLPPNVLLYVAVISNSLLFLLAYDLDACPSAFNPYNVVFGR